MRRLLPVLALVLALLPAAAARAQDPTGQDDPSLGDPSSAISAPAPAPPQLPGPAPIPSPPLPALNAPAPSAPPAAVTQIPTRRPRRALAQTAALGGPTVPGVVAQILPSGRAAAPAGAPLAVRRLIWTANRLIGLPYRYGGGHVSFSDTAYDCSGSVSYALHAAGLLAAPEDSSALMRWGLAGPGRWVTVYTDPGHAWLTVAGIRLDTSPVADPVGLPGPRWRPLYPAPRRFRVRRAA